MRSGGLEAELRIAIGGLVALLLASGAGAEPRGEALSRLLGSTTLRCSFGGGRVLWLDTNPPRDETTEFGGRDQFTFDAIDLGARTARIIGTVGAGDVRLIQTDNAITFIDSTNATVSSYTVFASYVPESKHFSAALSEHWHLLGKAVAAVYAGRCWVLQ